MRRKAIYILFITLLMTMVGVNTAYADEKDMGTWSEKCSQGHNIGRDMKSQGTKYCYFSLNNKVFRQFILH